MEGQKFFSCASDCILVISAGLYNFITKKSVANLKICF